MFSLVAITVSMFSSGRGVKTSKELSQLQEKERNCVAGFSEQEDLSQGAWAGPRAFNNPLALVAKSC